MDENGARRLNPASDISRRNPVGAQPAERCAGDTINAILSAAAMNFQKLLGLFGAIFCAPVRIWAGFRSYKSDAPSELSLQMLKAAFSGSTK